MEVKNIQEKVSLLAQEEKVEKKKANILEQNKKLKGVSINAHVEKNYVKHLDLKCALHVRVF